jgi:uncharacterized protein
MNKKHLHRLATELALPLPQIEATTTLLAQGGTVPFIARYRKEATGGLDEVAIAAIRDGGTRLAEVDSRRQSIVKSLKERQLGDPSLFDALDAATNLAALEDLYLPHRPKRRTRAMLARERGLTPLAQQLWKGDRQADPQALAAAYVDPAKELPDATAALAGARDIVAEWISEDLPTRQRLRDCFARQSVVSAKVMAGKEESGSKFLDYFAWDEPLPKAAGHRLLALFRGEKEEILTLRIRPPAAQPLALLHQMHDRGTGALGEQIGLAIEDSYKRLLSTAMEAETRLRARLRAGNEAIRVFADNARELLMASPMGPKTTLAIDPGFRTGCKVVALDRQGALLFNTTLFLTAGSEAQTRASVETLQQLCRTLEIEAIAIGNGTAGRETEAIVRKIRFSRPTEVVMVNESGASIYSASSLAREEFPDHDITVRGAVSIGRRLMDPLAELVKLDPKSIGVGQYQHDVDQAALKRTLDDVVETCVNAVGVDVNMASPQLLGYVAGIGPALAARIVAYREEHGAFTSRQALLAVPGLGPKSFEQAAGFLRVQGGAQPLDASAVHPERYALIARMAEEIGASLASLLTSEETRQRLSLDSYVSDAVGMPTLLDIMQELARPGRDPRATFEAFSFAEGITSLSDLTPGLKLPGLVTNVTKFGAFVDIGVHQDGLVHISELADRFVGDPADIVKVQQPVTVTVMEVDLERRRIALSMRETPGKKPERKASPRRQGAVPSSTRPAKPRPKQGKPRQPKRPPRRDFNGGAMSDAFSSLDI